MPSTKVCLPRSCRLLRIGGNEPASRAPIDHLCHPPRMLTMRLVQKAQNYFRKPALPPVIQRQAAVHDEQVGSSRSKRAAPVRERQSQGGRSCRRTAQDPTLRPIQVSLYPCPTRSAADSRVAACAGARSLELPLHMTCFRRAQSFSARTGRDGPTRGSEWYHRTGWVR